MRIRFNCKICGGVKFIGDPYYAFGTYFVDVTCLTCSDTKDIEVEKLNKILRALNKKTINNEK